MNPSPQSAPARRDCPALLFGLPRLATSYCHTALFVLTLPLIAQRLAGPGEKGWFLGLLTGGAAGLSILAVLVAGAYSDAGHGLENRLLRRRAQVGYGLCAAAGLGLAAALGLGPWSLALVLAAVMPARTLTDTAALSLLAEHPGLRPVERFSSAVSLFHFLGSALGAAAFGLASLVSARLDAQPQTLVASLAPLLVVFCWFGFSVVARRSAGVATGANLIQRSWALTKPLTLFMASRVFFQAGMFIVPTFLLYMVEDLMHAPQVSVTAAWLVGLTLVGAASFSWPAAHLTRRIGEVPALLWAGSVLALAVTFFVLGAGWSNLVGFCCMALYGAASGLVMTAGISLNMKLMPKEGGTGRIMALLAVSTFLSQLMASVAGGLALDRLNQISPGRGYVGLLALVLVLLALGAGLLMRMEKSRSISNGLHPDGD